MGDSRICDCKGGIYGGQWGLRGMGRVDVIKYTYEKETKISLNIYQETALIHLNLKVCNEL